MFQSSNPQGTEINLMPLSLRVGLVSCFSLGSTERSILRKRVFSRSRVNSQIPSRVLPLHLIFSTTINEYSPNKCIAYVWVDVLVTVAKSTIHGFYGLCHFENLGNHACCSGGFRFERPYFGDCHWDYLGELGCVISSILFIFSCCHVPKFDGWVQKWRTSIYQNEIIILFWLADHCSWQTIL